MKQDKTVLPALIGEIVLCVVCCFFIYYGIHTDQIILSILGGVLLVVGIIRFVIFMQAYKKRGE
ncbi:SemiSWEET family transporter [Erysipelotrichaceae bacterium HCN-30851]